MPLSSSAWVYYQYGYPSRFIGINVTTFNDYWANTMITATDNWYYSTNGSVNPHLDPYSTNTTSIDFTIPTNRKYATYQSSGNPATRFWIVFYTHLIILDATNHQTFLTSVIAHEVGHALFLKDLEFNSTSLMGYLRDRNILYTQQQDDINGVLNKWPL